jgi:hypothetical protein
LALLNLTTPYAQAALVAAAPVEHRLDVLRAVNPALHAELERIEANPTSAVSRARKLTSASVVELVRYVTNRPALRALGDDPRDAVLTAVRARACELHVDLTLAARTKRVATPLSTRTEKALAKPVADVIAWLGTTREVFRPAFDAWCADVTPEKTAVWNDIVTAAGRLHGAQDMLVKLAFEHDLGAASFAGAGEYALISALYDWTGDVNDTVLGALRHAVADGFEPKMYKHRKLTATVPADAPFSLRTVLGLVTPAELDAELHRIAADKTQRSWFIENEIITLASFATDPATVAVAAAHLKRDGMSCADDAAAALLTVPGLSFALRSELLGIVGASVIELIVDDKLEPGDIDAFVAALAASEHPAEAVSDVASRAWYHRNAEQDFSWLFSRMLNDVPAAAMTLVASYPELVMAHAAARIGKHPDAWGVILSEVTSYDGLFNELIDAAIAACS